MRFKELLFSCRCGEERFSVRTSHSFENDIVSVRINDTGIFTVSVTAAADIRILRLEAVFERSFSPQERIFLSGYQSWTDSTEHTINDTMRGIKHIPRQINERFSFSQYGDYTFAEYPGKPGQLHGFTYGYIRSGETYSFFGSLNEDSGFTQIKTDTRSSTISFEKDCRGLTLRAGTEYDGIRLYTAEGTENSVFDGYFSQLGITLRPDAVPMSGYTSWYRHYQNINEGVITRDLAALRADSESGFGARVFQIDDGFQTAVGDWLSIDKGKFPGGMQPVAEKISSEGYIPGIWLAPFVCEEGSELFSEHNDWILRDRSGTLVRAGSNWSGSYALDICNRHVRDYIRHVIDTAVNVWGFKLLKLDFLYAACILPRSDRTRGQIMAQAMDFLRECAGDAYILACGVPLAAAFGRADYCRIGCDVSPDWDDKPYMRLAHRERISTKNSLLNTVFRRQLNGRAFINDPDVFILRSTSNTMTLRQRQCLAEINAAAGGVFFTSDNFAEYSPQQKKILSEILNFRSAVISSASLADNILRVEYALGNETIIRSYKL